MALSTNEFIFNDKIKLLTSAFNRNGYTRIRCYMIKNVFQIGNWVLYIETAMFLIFFRIQRDFKSVKNNTTFFEIIYSNDVKSRLVCLNLVGSVRSVWYFKMQHQTCTFVMYKWPKNSVEKITFLDTYGTLEN